MPALFKHSEQALSLSPVLAEDLFERNNLPHYLPQTYITLKNQYLLFSENEMINYILLMLIYWDKQTFSESQQYLGKLGGNIRLRFPKFLLFEFSVN